MTALKFERLKVTLAMCFPKIYQTTTKPFAKEQDAARQTHASPSYDLNAANGVPNDADLQICRFADLQICRFADLQITQKKKKKKKKLARLPSAFTCFGQQV